MSRRSFFRASGRAAALFGFGAAGLAASCAAWAAPIEWKLATGYPDSSFHVVNLRQFASDVEKASAGKLRIKVHSGGSLIKAGEIRKAITDGTVDAGEMFGPSFGALHPAFALDALPFLATSYPAAQRLSNAARPTVRDQLASQGYVLLYSVSWPPQGLFSNKPIRSAADFQGLRIRENSPPVKRLAELLGGTPVRIETPELEAAIKDKKIDAVFTSAAQGVDTQMYKSLPYFYTANAWLPRNIVVVSKKSFDALGPAVQETLMKIAVAAEANGEKLSEENARDTVEQLRKAGANVDALPFALRGELDRLGDKVATEMLSKQKDSGLISILGVYLAGK